MKPKSILFGALSALVLVVLFNNREEATFWLFGDIRTSKLLILAVFFVLGLICGGLLFRRKNKQPKEYSISNSPMPSSPDNSDEEPYPHLSAEDREFIRRD